MRPSLRVGGTSTCLVFVMTSFNCHLDKTQNQPGRDSQCGLSTLGWPMGDCLN